MTVGSLFSGIGGLDLGLERAGLTCAWMCEKDPERREVLKRHWPETRIYDDITGISWRTGKGWRRHWHPEPVDALVGGVPCQPFSVAGRRRGEADNRNLWPETLRLVRELRPKWFLGENVPGLCATPYFETICGTLESYGYAVLPLEIPAAAFDADHYRFRLFLVAHLAGERGWGKELDLSAGRWAEGQRAVDADGTGESRDAPNSGTTGRTRSEERHGPQTQSDRWPIALDSCWGRVEPVLVRDVHGLPAGLDRAGLRAARKRRGWLGDAVVPQVAEWIGRRIMEAEKEPI